MKSFKLLLAALLLCVSQLALAVATPAQQVALDNALAAVALDVNNQALVDAAVQAAANADIAADDIVTRLFNLGVPEQSIRDAIAASVNAGVNGTLVACAPACGPDHLTDVAYTSAATLLADNTLAALGATGAGGGAGTGGTGGGLPGTSGGPTGAVTPG